ncbi:alpha/beta fold hydrolase [Microbacterium karelineae]|uniref:alpha/beta fold hydrolase n=1 Tax=Microbacterium karelineae TaxID=2654283 RepID=UPI0012EADD3F|nr:alpha/beta hydrolase [Microbacterium karelineae]
MVPSGREDGVKSALASDDETPVFDLYREDHPGARGTAVLLHGWPGDHGDWRQVVHGLAGRVRTVTPDLRGFGRTRPVGAVSVEAFGVQGQADSVIGLIESLGGAPVVLGGYDIGSRIAVRVATMRPDLVRGLVLAPPLPGAGARVLSPTAQPNFWYQTFHQLDLSVDLLDGSPAAVRRYLAHFWDGWSAPDFSLPSEELDRLAALYARPGAFRASVSWYRAGAGTVATSPGEILPPLAERLATPSKILWPDCDPLFPSAWSDRLDGWFVQADLRHVEGAGHFLPREAPGAFVEAVLELMDSAC